MTPDIELQLQVIIKSLKDNVAPAIDASNQLAQEQLHLSIAALEITLGHVPLAHHYLRRDIAENSALASKMLALCVDDASQTLLSTAIQQARDSLVNAANGASELLGETRKLREAIGSALVNNADSPNVEAIEKLVIDCTEATNNMGRAWNKPHGFEPKPDDVTELIEQLNS